MQFLFHQQLSIISVIVLLSFLMYSFSVLDKNSNINKVYIVSLFLNLIIIVLDIAFDFIIKKGSISVYVPRVIGGLIFLLSPILSYLFLQFVCSYFSNYKIKRLIKTIFTVLLTLNSVVAFFSFKSKMFIESINISEYKLPFLISIIFLFYSSFVIFSCKKMLIKFEYVYMISISVIAIVLVLTQLFLNDAKFIWSGYTFILILMFIVIQQRELYRDPLTGARNRLVLKKCLDAYNKKKEGNLSVVMIDLDYFKNINDYQKCI